METTFQEIAAILALAFAAGLIGRVLKQPLIVSFIAVGILAGPSGFSLVSAHDLLGLLSEMGIALLLFIVGLKLDLTLIRNTGPVALATGLGQVLFTSLVGFGIAISLGISPLASLYVAVALTFSSTIIIVKLLSDKGEIETLHGQIAVGFLIVQDMVVILVMIFLAALGAAGNEISVTREIIEVAVKATLFVIAIGLAMKYVIPRLVKLLSASPELLILFSVSWAIALAAIGEWLNFSGEVGAFLAGVSLASTPYREVIGSRLVSLRDFLLLFFFIHLGSELDLAIIGQNIGDATIFSLFVLIGNPLIVILIMGYMGYRKRTGFLAGLTVAQISEFSLILIAMGYSIGHVSEEIVALVTLTGLITIGCSTYLILYSHPIYNKIGHIFSAFERKDPYREKKIVQAKTDKPDILVFGLGRFGSNLLQNLRNQGFKVHGFDFNPDIISELKARGYDVYYGDAGDPEWIKSLPFKNADFVISCMPDTETNLTVIKTIRSIEEAPPVGLSAYKLADVARIEKSDPDILFSPFADAAGVAVEKLVHKLSKRNEKPAD